MQTNIEFDPAYALLTVNLEPGETIKAEPGAMVAQRGVQMETGSAGGGLMGGFKRMLGGESFFINTFTAGSGGGQVSLAPATPGDIGTFDLDPGQNLFIQASSFMACTANVQTDSQFQGFQGAFQRGERFLPARVRRRRSRHGLLQLIRGDQAADGPARQRTGSGHGPPGGIH